MNTDLFGETVVIPEDVPAKEEKVYQHDVWDWMKSVKETKIDLRTATITSMRGTGDNKVEVTIPPDPYLKSLSMYKLLEALAQNESTAEFAYMLNNKSHLPKEMQYVLLLRIIPPHRSYGKWIRKKSDKRLEKIKEIYNCSDAKAAETIYTLSEEQIDNMIKQHDGRNAKCKKTKSK